MRRQDREGWSLIELLFVIVIIAILAALALPRYMRSVDCRYEREARDVLHQLLNAEQVYRSEYGRYTSDITKLAVKQPREGEPLEYRLYADATPGLEQFIGWAGYRWTSGGPRYQMIVRYQPHVWAPQVCVYEPWPCGLVEPCRRP